MLVPCFLSLLLPFSKQQFRSNDDKCSNNDDKCSNNDEKCSNNDDKCSNNDEKCSNNDDKCSNNDDKPVLSVIISFKLIYIFNPIILS